MALSFTDIVEEARLSARALLDYGDHFFNPTVRLGVTGLSRAGKTVFITALVHGLTRGLFRADLEQHWASFKAYDVAQAVIARPNQAPGKRGV